MHNYKNGLAVPVFLCSLTESNHVLMLAIVSLISPLHFSQPHKTVFVFKTILPSESSIIPHDPPHWLIPRSEVSVYFTGLRNTRFRSVTLRKSIAWNLAPEEKVTLFPPAFTSSAFFKRDMRPANTSRTGPWLVQLLLGNDLQSWVACSCWLCMFDSFQ